MKKSPTRGAFRFRQSEHLKRRDEIEAVFGGKRVVTCPGAKLFILKNGLSHNRIVFTMGRNFGNAVQRNRSRRVSREAYRLMRSGLKSGYDLVLLVYPGVNPKDGQRPPPRGDYLARRMEQMRFLFAKAGLRAPEKENIR